MSLEETAREYSIDKCVDCDRCEPVCPIRSVDGRFSPSALAKAFLGNQTDLEGRAAFTLWSCTSCRACLARCPKPPPDFSGFIPNARTRAREQGMSPPFPFSGALQRIMAMTAERGLTKQRLDWVEPELRRAVPDGGLLYFTGCAPLLDVALGSEFNPSAVDTLRAGLDVIRRLDPDLEIGFLPDEICCGHDFLISGNMKQFLKHARLLSEQINSTSAKTVKRQAGWSRS